MPIAPDAALLRLALEAGVHFVAFEGYEAGGHVGQLSTLNLAQMPGVGTRINATIQINREVLTFELNDGKESADVDVAGIFYNDKGKPINSFVGRLKIFPVPVNSSSKNRPVVYGVHEWLPAGLFQVRVGVRDLKSGRIGSAMQWIQIPNLSAH